MLEYVAPKVNESDRTIAVADLPTMTRFRPTIAGMYPDIEFYVHKREDYSNKFDGMLLEWKDGTRLFLDLKSVNTFLALCSIYGAGPLLVAIKEHSTTLDGIYKVV